MKKRMILKSSLIDTLFLLAIIKIEDLYYLGPLLRLLGSKGAA